MVDTAYEEILFENQMMEILDSHDKKDPFFCEKILHIEYLKNDLSKKGIDFYKQKNIQYLIFTDLRNNLNVLKKTIFFLMKNY